MTIEKHGIYDQYEGDQHLENIKRNGFTVLKNIVPKKTIIDLKKKLNLVYETQIKEIGGIKNLQKMKDNNIARALFAYDEIFLKKIIMNPIVVKYLNLILDDHYILFSQTGVFSEPTKKLNQIAWHREVQYQHFTSNKPMGLQALFLLDPFTKLTGGTFYLPGSHMFDELPSDKYIKNNQIQPINNAGDVVLADPMVYHRAGLNSSKKNRLLISNTFLRPSFASHFDYTKMIDPKRLNTKEKEILGFRWNYNETMNEWRKKRIL